MYENFYEYIFLVNFVTSHFCNENLPYITPTTGTHDLKVHGLKFVGAFFLVWPRKGDMAAQGGNRKIGEKKNRGRWK